MKRDLLSLQDVSPDEIFHLLELTAQLKQYKGRSSDHLRGKTIGLLFQKPSNRTRVSFDVGICQLGGNCIYLGPAEINLGIRESAADVSKTLSRYLDAIVARTNTHADIVEMAKNATIPVINGLSDLFHPCQGLTDIFSIREHFKTLEKISVAYVGDGNNVCNSLLLACAKTGVNIRIATPPGYEPPATVVAIAEGYAQQSKARILLTNDPVKAVADANVIYSDVWVSMGQEEEAQKRIDDFRDFQINGTLVKGAAKDFIFMHCLPAHRGLEVTEDVIDGKRSIIFDQAENRLHTQKAILIFLMKQQTKGLGLWHKNKKLF
jgi:ornithine carbamoyltransferase